VRPGRRRENPRSRVMTRPEQRGAVAFAFMAAAAVVALAAAVWGWLVLNGSVCATISVGGRRSE
jgi:hypothetical protein